MSDTLFEQVAGSAFEQIVAETEWRDTVADRLRIITNLGWLGLVDEREQVSAIVGFSVESVDEDTITPPASLEEVPQRLGRITSGLFNTDMTAKGLGSMIANTPQALQPRSITDRGIAVRSLPLTAEAKAYDRKEADGALAQKWRLLRHGSLLAVAMAGDRLTSSDRGTQAVVDFMQRKYGDARVVRLPVPPIWLLQQDKAGVKHYAAPQVRLVRGGALAGSNEMSTIGHYPSVAAV